MATKKKETKPKVVLESYTLSATINRGGMEFLKPEITVKAPSLQEAADFLYPHIEQLFRVHSINKPEVIEHRVVQKGGNIEDRPAPKVNHAAFEKASGQIKLAMNEEALDELKKKILESVKLSEDQKGALMIMVDKRKLEVEKFLPKK